MVNLNWISRLEDNEADSAFFDNPPKLLILLKLLNIIQPHASCRMLPPRGYPVGKFLFFALIYMQSFISSTDEKLNFVCRTTRNFTEMWLESCFNISIQIYAAICQQHVIIQRKSKLSSFHDLLANCKELWTSFFSIISNSPRYLNCSPVAASYLSVNFHNRKLFHVSKINSRENWSMSLQIVSVDRWRRWRERTFRNVIWIFKYFHISCLDSCGCSRGEILWEFLMNFGTSGRILKVGCLNNENNKGKREIWYFKLNCLMIGKPFR